MKTYVLHRFIDWRRVTPLQIAEQLWREPVDIAAWAQLAWDDEGFRVRLTAREANIRAEETGPLGRPWQDSCLEFFFAPMPADPRYINIEFNPNACCCLGLGDGLARTRLVPDRDWLEPRAFRLEGGWGVEYRVPFALVRQLFPGFDPRPGDIIRANCYKCGDLTEREHYLAWNPVTCATPNFHQPCDFGRMMLAG